MNKRMLRKNVRKLLKNSFNIDLKKEILNKKKKSQKYEKL